VEDHAFGATRDEDRVHRVPHQAVEGKVSMTCPALCRNLALWGRPKRKQVERGGAREATVHAA
jgi:hypothetical protein